MALRKGWPETENESDAISLFEARRSSENINLPMCNRLSRLVLSMQTVARSVLDESVPRKPLLGDNRKNAKRLGRQTNVGTLRKYMATKLHAISQFRNLASEVKNEGCP